MEMPWRRLEDNDTVAQNFYFGTVQIPQTSGSELQKDVHFTQSDRKQCYYYT